MQIVYFITDYLQIKWHICICIFWTTVMAKKLIYLNLFEKYLKMQHFLKTPIRQ